MAKEYGDLYFVVNAIPQNPKVVSSINAAEMSSLKSLNSMAKKAGGSIIVTELHDDMIDQVENASINCIPTDDEAVDFVFMEQMESEFMDDDDDDDDDDDL